MKTLNTPAVVLIGLFAFMFTVVLLVFITGQTHYFGTYHSDWAPLNNGMPGLTNKVMPY